MEQKNIMFYLRLVYFALEREKNIYFEQMNITSSQGDILLFLGDSRKEKLQINQKQIEEHFQLSNPTITGLLSRMEKKNLIRRVKSPTDGRTKLIFLTQESQEMFDHFQQYAQSIKDRLCTDIPESDQAVILSHLKKMLSNLRHDSLSDFL